MKQLKKLQIIKMALNHQKILNHLYQILILLNEVEKTCLRLSHPYTMFIKAASPMNYTWTKEEQKYLKFDNHCVEDNLIGFCGTLIKNSQKEKKLNLVMNFITRKINLLNIAWNSQSMKILTYQP